MSNTTATDYELRYLKALETYNINLDELPKDDEEVKKIRAKINAIKPTLAKYKAKQTEGLKNMLVKQDTDVTELIMNYAEKGLPDEPTNEPPASEPPAAASTPPANEPPAAATTPANEPPAAAAATPANEPPATPPASTESAEEKHAKAILKVMEETADKWVDEYGEKLISTMALRAILQRSPKEPKEKVGSLKLEKLFCLPYYRVVS